MEQLDTITTQKKEHDKLHALSYEIMLCAYRGKPTVDFLIDLSKALISFIGCDAIEIWIGEATNCCRWEGTKIPDRFYRLKNVSKDKLISLCNTGVAFYSPKNESQKTDIYNNLLDDEDLFTKNSYLSYGRFPLRIDSEYKGLIILKSNTDSYFQHTQSTLYKNIADTLAIAMAFHNISLAQRERVKELTCLYKIGKASSRPYYELDAILQQIAEFIPPAWQYPDIVYGKITLDDKNYESPRSGNSHHTQKADIVVNNKRRGVVEVHYLDERPDIDEGPFLNEERHLINLIAREVAVLVEQKQADVDRRNLQEQLRHADRLATIGQIAAGVAHELNEPLGGILGLAQLAKKIPDLPVQAEEDLNKIELASMHGREIIRKLMLFARQTPPCMKKTDLNKVINDAISFLETRCSKAGVDLHLDFNPRLPKIVADSVQLNQVLINLVVNSIHAMPQGGRLTIETNYDDESVCLNIIDTGTGMSKETLKQAFDPFFTTKDIGQGTGLGLPVVHGIITSHNGDIQFTSKTGLGTHCEIKFPLKALQNDDR